MEKPMSEMLIFRILGCIYYSSHDFHDFSMSHFMLDRSSIVKLRSVVVQALQSRTYFSKVE